ncbi:hypothetical protein L1987_37014 [Smallanthus sonchifolius]|uniref:Uncharacterized protein n=1 Tax=Smallanthus sonchifolius TaxID=185202 RepID=A0ACB9HG15_9ASTR|nr:hypothetical protein L1987_37014 [Smallanthus sonchifolius]
MSALVVIVIVLVVAQPSNKTTNTNTPLKFFCGSNYAMSPAIFSMNLNSTFSQLRSQLSNTGVYYAQAQTVENGDAVYGVAQCRNYLLSNECLACFDVAVSSIEPCGSANGATVFLDNCFLRKFRREAIKEEVPVGNSRKRAGGNSRPHVIKEVGSYNAHQRWGEGRSFKEVLTNQSGTRGRMNEDQVHKTINVQEDIDASGMLQVKALVGRVENLNALINLKQIRISIGKRDNRLPLTLGTSVFLLEKVARFRLLMMVGPRPVAQLRGKLEGTGTIWSRPIDPVDEDGSGESVWCSEGDSAPVKEDTSKPDTEMEKTISIGAAVGANLQGFS